MNAELDRINEECKYHDYEINKDSKGLFIKIFAWVDAPNSLSPYHSISTEIYCSRDKQTIIAWYHLISEYMTYEQQVNIEQLLFGEV